MFKLATAVLLLLGVNTPSIAQRCIADTLASRVYDEKTRELTYVLSSGAVYRTLPVVAEGDHTYLTEKDLEPWLGQGEPIFTCGDSVLLLVADQAKEYFVIPVVCVRRCLAARQR